MANWLAFTAFAGTLTALLLIFARRSEQLLAEAGDDVAAQRSGEVPSGRDVTPSASAGNEATREDEPAVVPAQRDGPRLRPDDAGVRTLADDATDTDEGVRASTGKVTESDDETESDGETDSYDAVAVDPAAELTPAMLLANVSITQGLVAVVIVAAGWYFGIPADAFGVTGDPSNSGLPAVAVGVAFGLALWVGNEAATTVADAAGAAYDESVRDLLAPDTGEGWLVLFAFALPVVALGEELLFRAALIGVPAAGFALSPWLLAVVASVAFALGHGAQGRVGVVVTGLLGFVLAAGYVLSGSLVVVVVAHYVVNATEFAVYEYAGRDGLFAAGGPTTG